jgi:hypothetical protein
VPKKQKPPKPLSERKRPGPKRPEVDPNVVEGMAAIGCCKTEIAKVVGVSVDTLDRQFADSFDKGTANRNLRLRQALWKSAIDQNNITAQIWLSKQYLGMSDKTEVTQKQAMRSYGPEATERMRAALRELAALEMIPTNGSGNPD